MQINWLIDEIQVPPLLHGDDKQTFICIEQSDPWNPGKHEQVKSLSLFVHVAPFLHGKDRLILIKIEK